MRELVSEAGGGGLAPNRTRSEEREGDVRLSYQMPRSADAPGSREEAETEEDEEASRTTQHVGSPPAQSATLTATDWRCPRAHIQRPTTGAPMAFNHVRQWHSSALWCRHICNSSNRGNLTLSLSPQNAPAGRRKTTPARGDLTIIARCTSQIIAF